MVKKCLLFVVTVLFAVKTHAQIDFQEYFINDGFNYIVQPVFIHGSDIDGDGDNDIVSFGQQEIGWHENIDGQGTFVSKKTIRINNTGVIVASLAIADLDGDGDNDVVASIPFENKVVWYENTDGLGNFSDEQVIITSVIYPEYISVVDINGDGDMDVLVASYQDSEVAWYENTDGLGNFGSKNLIASNATFFINGNDLDNDGDIDVLTTSTNDKIAWYENIDGLGTFGTEQIITASVSAPNLSYVTDIDGDGDNDLLSSTFNDNNIYWQENTDGQGSFGATQIITTDSNITSSIYADDIDDDGDMDLISASGLNDKIAWYENTDGLGTFVEEVISFDADFGESVYAVDIDGDGDLDALSASRIDHKIAWYENTDGMGDFGTDIIITQMRVRDIESIFVEDIDGDGKMDVISASANVDGVYWHKNINNQSQFSVPILISSEIEDITDLVVSDIDYDGDMDIIIASQEDNNVVWLENLDGLGTFSEPNLVTSGSTALSIFVADMDGDGFNDVITYTGLIRWMKNVNGEGVFVNGDTMSGIFGLVSVFASDLDDDNDIDILYSAASTTGGSSSNYVAWLENTDGLGNLGNEQIISDITNYPESIYATDLNQDGFVDVISASRDDDKIAWYQNDGFGVFGSQQVVSTLANGVNTIIATDMDGDGDSDLISASRFDNKLAWYENTDGFGAFGSQQIITSQANAVGTIYAEDIDSDGDMDVITAYPTQSTGGNLPESVIYYENTSSLSIDDHNFNSPTLYPNPTIDYIYIKGYSVINSVSVYGPSGRLIKTEKPKSLNLSYQIDVKDLSKGVYFLEIQSGEAKSTKKFIKI